jgi:hypothetical protein
VGSAGSQEVPKAALQAFFQISKAWGLAPDEECTLLGGPTVEMLSAWRKNAAKAQLTRDTIERISYILGIQKALHSLLPDRDSADAWVRRPNKAQIFGGATALDRMLAGNVSDLYVVRKYLDVVTSAGLDFE